MNNGQGTIIYIGGFMLPDKNAAAQRVVSNAKIFSSIGYQVVFVDIDNSLHSKKYDAVKQKPVFGFDRWSVPESTTSWESFIRLFAYKQIIDVIKQYKDVKAIIAYNYPAYALNGLLKYCRQNKILCLADVTEWYGTKGHSLIYKITKGLDTHFRMVSVHKKLDGVIVISRTLEKYYESSTKVLLLPPLTDASDLKWKKDAKKDQGVIRLVYSGCPSSEKENMLVVINAVSELKKKNNIFLDVVGISAERMSKIYNGLTLNKNAMKFHGKLSHEESLEYVKRADYSLIIRDKNRVTMCGFPTKFSESITCGTPVIATDSSDLFDYIIDGVNGYIVSIDSFKDDIGKIVEKSVPNQFDTSVFDFHNYIDSTECFINSVLKNTGKYNG